jgi:hypothetical protein
MDLDMSLVKNLKDYRTIMENHDKLENYPVTPENQTQIINQTDESYKIEEVNQKLKNMQENLLHFL